jgi:hypothetical protein
MSRSSGCRVGLAPTGKRRFSTAHTQTGHRLQSGRLLDLILRCRINEQYDGRAPGLVRRDCAHPSSPKVSVWPTTGVTTRALLPPARRPAPTLEDVVPPATEQARSYPVKVRLELTTCGLNFPDVEGGRTRLILMRSHGPSSFQVPSVPQRNRKVSANEPQKNRQLAPSGDIASPFTAPELDTRYGRTFLQPAA